MTFFVWVLVALWMWNHTGVRIKTSRTLRSRHIRPHASNPKFHYCAQSDGHVLKRTWGLHWPMKKHRNYIHNDKQSDCDLSKICDLTCQSAWFSQVSLPKANKTFARARRRDFLNVRLWLLVVDFLFPTLTLMRIYTIQKEFESFVLRRTPKYLESKMPFEVGNS